MTTVQNEQAQEPTGAPPSPEEPEEGSEPQEQPQGPQEPDGEPTGDDGDVSEPEAETQKPSGRSEKEIEAVYRKVEAENVRHAKRVSEIAGDDATSLTPCPLCFEGTHGFLGLIGASEEGIAKARALLGMFDPSKFKHDPHVDTCTRCDGQGQLATGSKVPGHEARTCTACMGNGYVGETPPLTQPSGNGPAAEVKTGPTVYETASEDPMATMLRERGYTVIAPLRLPQT